MELFVPTSVKELVIEETVWKHFPNQTLTFYLGCRRGRHVVGEEKPKEETDLNHPSFNDNTNLPFDPDGPSRFLFIVRCRDVLEDEVRTACEKFGEVADCHKPKEKGFAFVEMVEFKDALKVHSELERIGHAEYEFNSKN